MMDKFIQMGTQIGGWTPATAPHWSLSSTSKGHKVGPNRYLCAKIFMIWEAMTEVEYKYEQMISTQLGSHANMVIVGQHAIIINWLGKSAYVRPLFIDCSKLESVPIVEAVVAYDFPHTLEIFKLVVKNGLYMH